MKYQYDRKVKETNENTFYIGGMVFHIIGEEDGKMTLKGVDFNAKKIKTVQAIYNPICDYWNILNAGDGIGHNIINCYRFVIDSKIKTLFLIIPKNACSTILGMAMRNDEYTFTGSPWVTKNVNEYQIWSPDFDKIQERYGDYKKVCVYTDEKERFIRYLNYCKRIYNLPEISYDCSDEKYVDQFLFLYPYTIKNAKPNLGKDNYDEHTVPQSYYIKKALEYVPREQIEFVKLKDFPSWYKATYGIDVIKENVTDVKKTITWNTLTDEQRSKIEEYIKESNEYLKSLGLEI